jgi:hypothetical protein
MMEELIKELEGRVAHYERVAEQSFAASNESYEESLRYLDQGDKQKTKAAMYRDALEKLKA